ncbi:LysR family transcriptional regulator [Amycolatopsis australiensis]|uniref:DNA-binding transcriptional regulator, LysR family n=1 Tax=Amycolatopsis australiensis TaxID=546364 RepID=A0A1K1STC7_9PSEU|nr:LysR family transcriptional regulator [Amycolatopsis australiensis]SFW87534.1 DNA-binding transcriptional regulator, LysR family [Amycolatopsis australiensis]
MAESREIETFLVLAEELHFGHSAQRLRVSTAQVSQTIRKLERRIGVPLFTRTSRRVELTPVGRQLLAGLGPAWSAVESALAKAVQAGRGVTGTLRVAFGDAAGAQLLAGVAELFRRRLPGCEVEFREVRPAEVLPWLREDEVDVVLAGLPLDGPGLVTGPVLVRERRFLAVAADHPFARRDAVPVAELARATVLRCALPDPWFDEHAPAAAVRPRAGLQELLTLAGAGAGVLPVGAHVRRYYPRPDVAYVPLADAPLLEWGLVWRAGAGTARVRAFAEAAADLVREPA